MLKSRIASLVIVPAVAFVLMGGTTVKPGGAPKIPNNGNGNGNNNNNNKNSKDSKPGSSDTVKKWKDDDLDDAKKSELPICVYIYDDNDKNNTRAKQIEGPTALNSAEVRDKLKAFKCVKLKESDAKHWPADWATQAKGGAVLVFASSDMKQLQMIDKNFPHENITVANLETMIENILKYEEQKKAAKQPAKK
jgi:hypothetical protein